MKTEIFVSHVLMRHDAANRGGEPIVVIVGKKSFDEFPVTLNVGDVYRTTKKSYTVQEVELWDKNSHFLRLLYCKPIIESEYCLDSFNKLKEETKNKLSYGGFEIDEITRQETIDAFTKAYIKEVNGDEKAKNNGPSA